jgi:hypothetical protein
MLQPKPQRESEWTRLQEPSQEMQFGNASKEPSAAPIDPESIHDARGLKILIVVIVLGAALAIAWIAQNKRTASGPAEIRPGQGVTVTSGPQHALKRTPSPSKPIHKSNNNPPQQ